MVDCSAELQEGMNESFGLKSEEYSKNLRSEL